MIEKLVLLVIAVLMLIAGVAVWQDAQSPHFQLKKSDWVCTREKLETILMPVSTGNSTTLIPETSSVCVEYRRTGGP
ncbi:hypothetical protein [Pseudogulbenkiania sp. NH8B]|uniref:hypothetical protein n=1 Tax=Pseudogulbenkiania sp. (strain NH8B) TaxID=748280 RepID=UPI0011D2A566|nr:hypothetical protein [Pseudogulbenkiania sp. NH8B]